MKKLAVVFPGIGYTADKPLLHYCRRLAENSGYKTRVIVYSGFPDKAKGDRGKIRKACELAVLQAEEYLSDVDLTEYEDILFIGKSIGTVAAASLAAHNPARKKIRLLIYTPLEETFHGSLDDALAFTGSADPWVGGENSRIPLLCAQQDIPCLVVQNANHSLETADPLNDIRNMQEIMRLTGNYISREQVHRVSHYEDLLNKLKKLVSEPCLSDKKRMKVHTIANELSQYLASKEWKQDFADDEAGLLPKNLKRGVLTEDGIFSTLELIHEQMEMDNNAG